MLIRRQILGASVVLIAACGDVADPATTVEPPGPEQPAVPATPGRTLAVLELGAYQSEFFVGSVASIFVRGIDSSDRNIDASQVVLTSSNPSVVSLSARSEFLWKNQGSEAKGVRQVVTMAGPGTAVVRGEMSGVTGSIVFKVRAIPQASSAIAIDTFSVVEYRVPCAWECPYIAYAPLLKLREPTGKAPVYLLAVQFDLPSKSTGLCNVGQLRLEPGFTGHINAIHEYLWANSMLVVQLDGSPLPEGKASVRVIFRDAEGNHGMAEATADIQRMVSNPEFPPSRFSQTEWFCASQEGG